MPASSNLDHVAGLDHLAPVLVGVNRLGSRAAVQYAALEARRSGRPLHLLHVAPSSDGWFEQVGRDALRGAVRQADSVLVGGATATPTLVHGSVVPELVRHAAHAALLVMERMPSAQQRVPSTRTTGAVCAAVDTPVVLVPADWVDPCRNVVSVGLEPEAVDEHAIDAALRLARLRGDVLRVVVSVPRGGDIVRVHVLDLLDAMGGDACDFAVEVVTEAPRAALAHAAATSDLLVVGRRRPVRTEGSRLGPVTAAVLEDLVCPVLLTTPGRTSRLGATPGPAALTHQM